MPAHNALEVDYIYYIVPSERFNTTCSRATSLAPNYVIDGGKVGRSYMAKWSILNSEVWNMNYCAQLKLYSTQQTESISSSLRPQLRQGILPNSGLESLEHSSLHRHMKLVLISDQRHQMTGGRP
ncbi:hypothetical protein FPOA_04402 [Fusarium poae]|uniref:Uncharacterized protein n=1 Tax=Fusarium poae TaxID=36050 RepID=A0A1B8AU14_FUSPO|nr:hypothetical protein FPOA_04402 [Fusarium poae]